LRPIVEASTPEELAMELGPADVANIAQSPHHYATHLVERVKRIKAAKWAAVKALRSDIASAATDEEHDRLKKELEALLDK
jgi:hypothetical protein